MVKTEELIPRLRSTRVIRVIVTEVYEGKGEVDDVGRIVTYIHDLDGSLLAVNDPFPDGKVQ